METGVDPSGKSSKIYVRKTKGIEGDFKITLINDLLCSIVEFADTSPSMDQRNET